MYDRLTELHLTSLLLVFELYDETKYIVRHEDYDFGHLADYLNLGLIN
jgi:hypothetical protein